MMKETGSTSASKPLDQQQQEVSIPVLQIPPFPPPIRIKPNLPIQDLIEGPKEEYLGIGVPLYEASVRCDWSAAKDILDKKPELVRYSLTENGDTALHIAASIKRSKHVEKFVKNLVDIMGNKDLELQNKSYSTALYLAAATGNIKPVRIMVEKNRTLTTIPGGSQGRMLLLYVAALFGHYEVAKYLHEISNDLRDDDWDNRNRGWLLEKCVEGDMFDIALGIERKYPGLASGEVLGILARKPEMFYKTETSIMIKIKRGINSVTGLKVGAPEKESSALTLLRFIWSDILKKPNKEIMDIIRGPRDYVKKRDATITRATYSSRVLFLAAEMGNTTFLVELIRQCPDLIWKVNDDNQSVFHIGVKHHHEGIYNLLYEIGAMKDMITPLKDENDDNMLHLAGKMATKERLAVVSGAALQMQRELLWKYETWSPLLIGNERTKMV